MTSQPIEILMVDDRPDNLLALAATLDAPDYRLVKANSGDEALRYLLDHDPALILMDVQMPGLDGFETAQIIKKSERSRDIPIIFITAINKEERYVHTGYESGAVDYISKPFDPAVLRSKVAVFADLYRKTRKLISQEKLLREAELRETERKLAQLELRALRREHAERQKYISLVEGIEHGIVWSADPSTLSVHFISDAAEKILLYPKAQWRLESSFIARHIHPDDLVPFQRALNNLMETHAQQRLEHRFYRADGTLCWLNTWMSLSRKSEDEPEELRGLSVDITPLKRSQQQLRRSREDAAFLARAGLTLSQSLDPETILSQAEKLAVPALGDWLFISTAGTAEMPPKIRFFSDDAADSGRCDRATRLLDLIEQAVRTSDSTEAIPFSSDPDSHRPLPALESLGVRSVIVTPLVSRGEMKGRMVFVNSRLMHTAETIKTATDFARRFAVALDNSDLYAQARSAIAMRDEFFSIASHELKTPLTPIKLQLQQLLRLLDSGGGLKNVPEERVRKAIVGSNRQVNKLAKLVDELLDISRIRSGKLTIEPVDFDLGELAHEVVERFTDEAAQAKCRFELKLHSSVPVFLDRFRIEQVVVNLITNAIKYGPGSVITIEVGEEEGLAVLKVRDQGIGIAPEDQKRIFERFERAVPSINYAGLGLGLFIVTEILRAQGGKIQLQSELGKGSQFSILLPRRYEQPAAVNAESLRTQQRTAELNASKHS